MVRSDSVSDAQLLDVLAQARQAAAMGLELDPDGAVFVARCAAEARARGLV